MALDTVFCPKSIALVGASRTPKSVGNSLLVNLIKSGYIGRVIPINPNAEEILGVKCEKSLLDLNNAPPDLVIVAVPAKVVFEVVKEAQKIGVKAIIIISAGFKETGNEGALLEREIADYCKNNDITLIGPNCLGVINPLLKLNASFETVMPLSGHAAFVSQSGALVSSLVDIANSRGLGFSKIISVGNKAQVSELELLPYLFADTQTKVILLYTEALKNAPKLIEIVRNNQLSENPKPIVMLKAGSTSSGQKASSSHTGSLAGSDAAYEALAKQAGIIRVLTVQELLTTADFLVNNQLPHGRNLAIITNAGGPGIIATDKSEKASLTMAELAKETKEKLKNILPAASHADNPVDVLGDATSERYNEALTSVLDDHAVDSAMVIVTPQSMTDILETAAVLSRIKAKYKTPMVASFIGSEEVDLGNDLLSMCKISHTQFPEDGIQAIGYASDFAINAMRKNPPAKFDREIPKEIGSLAEDLKHKAVKLLDAKTTFSLLENYGLPVVKSIIVQQPQDYEKVTPEYGNNFALKIVSPDISHKSDVGGVLLNITREKLEEGIGKILHEVKSRAPKAQTNGVLIQEMIDKTDGQEIILGLKKEPELGTMLMLGMGGIFVELLSDVVFRFAPINEKDALEMIDSLKAKRLLYGFRGSPPLDISAIVKGLMSLSHLATSLPDIIEVDINPFFVNREGKGARALDARIILG